ncbi:unnamed protein product [Allacma fusca]|uniref:Uncharacterized protein n=1 Tax=Allacma fusca TaxID=39272 RepID=A0A8J2PIS2_9HEXA|nr:unnamed protein product [Allacma fusca]
MGIFQTGFDNVIFILLFIVYLVALTRMLAVAQTSTFNEEYTNDSSSWPTTVSNTADELPSSTTEATSAPETTQSTMKPNRLENVVKIALIFEKTNVVQWFDYAVDYLNERSKTDLEFRVVSKFPANRSDDAVGLLTKICKHMDALASDDESKPDLVMDFTISGIPSEAVKVIMKTLKIPTVSTSVGQNEDVREWSLLSEKQEQYLIRVQPPMDLLDQAIRSISELQNLSNAAIFFQNDIEVNHKYKSILRDVPVKHKLLQLPTRFTSSSKYKIESQLDHLSKLSYTNYFLVASSEIISTMLSIAYNTMKHSTLNAWFTLSTDDGPISCNECQYSFNVVSLVPKYLESSKSEDSGRYLAKKLGKPERISLNDRIFYDLTIDAALAVGEQKLEKTWPAGTIGKIPCVAYDMKRSYPDLNIDIRTYFEDPSKLHGTYSISKHGRHYSVFKMEIQSLSFEPNRETPSSKPAGTWSAGFTGKGLIELKSPTILDSHVSHRIYRVVTVVNPPFVYRKSNCTSHVARALENQEYLNCYYGYSIDVMNTISKELNFNYTIFETKGYGDLNESPTKGWNGSIRVLVDGRADIALGALTHMPEREQVVDFTRRYHPMVGFQFVMQKPKVPSALFKFMMVLERDVWWCILGAYFFTSILLFIFDKFSPSSYRNNKDVYDNESDEPGRLFYFGECLWFCFTSMTPQGGGDAPKGLSGRLVASTWWLFSFIIIASYTANMAAFLTVSRLAKPILSLDDLINQHRVQFSAVIGSSAWVYFDRMANVEQIFYEYWRDLSLDDSLSDFNRSQLAVWTYPVSDKYTKLWQSMVTNRPPHTYRDGVTRALYVNKENPSLIFALIGEETDMKYLTMVHCTLQTVGSGFSKRAYAIAVQKGSPLKDAFNRVLDKMEKTRELEKIYDDWWKRNPYDKKCPRDYRIEDGINFANMGGLWIVLGVGMTCAVLAVIVEIILCQMDHKIQKFKTKVTVYKGKASTKPGISWMFLNRQKTDFKTDFKTEYSNTSRAGSATSEIRDARLVIAVCCIIIVTLYFHNFLIVTVHRAGLVGRRLVGKNRKGS